MTAENNEQTKQRNFGSICGVGHSQGMVLGAVRSRPQY